MRASAKAFSGSPPIQTDIQVKHVNIPTLTSTTRTFPGDVSGQTAANSRLARDFLAESPNTATLSMTAKFNVWANMLVTFTGLVPVSSAGLTDRFTPIIGLDYGW